MQKLYYSISDVSKLVDEEQHILRYWEKEFTQIKPRKNRAGNRVYSQHDLAVIMTIRKLLREEKLTLKNAKEKIKTIEIIEIEPVVGEIPDNKDDSYNDNFRATESETIINTVNIPKSESNLTRSDLIELKELLLDLKQLIAV